MKNQFTKEDERVKNIKEESSFSDSIKISKEENFNIKNFKYKFKIEAKLISLGLEILFEKRTKEFFSLNSVIVEKNKERNKKIKK